jgi:hypothetical protein
MMPIGWLLSDNAFATLIPALKSRLRDGWTGAVRGVIDFGSAGLDDPAIDLGFVSFWGASFLGRSFVEQLYDRYGIPASLLRRVRFFKTMIALLIALGGLQSGDRKTFELGLGPFM